MEAKLEIGSPHWTISASAILEFPPLFFLTALQAEDPKSS
jgi:hypothetical protein